MLVMVVLFTSLISACTNITITHIPTNTSEPTYSPTPTNSPQPTFTPTPTPFPESAFSINIIGYGVHGAMFELLYDGELDELEGINIQISTSQEGTSIETQVFSKIENRLLAEMTDAMYEFGDTNIALTFSSSESRIDLIIDYQNFIPWMNYYYGQSSLSSRLSYPWEADHGAWDLTPVSEKFPNGDGHPVNSPCNGIVFRAEIIPDSGDTHNMYIYCPETGYFVQLGHMENKVQIGDKVTPESLVGYLHMEQRISRPHNHTKIRKPNYFPVNMNNLIEANSSYVDIFSPQVQLGGGSLPYGFWLKETLPQSVKEFIDSGAFVWP